MIRLSLCLLIVSTLALASCKQGQEEADSHDDHGASTEQVQERGPHRGRMLRDGEFALELQIFEDGVDPEYHVSLFNEDKALPPTAALVTVELARLGGKVDRFSFTPKDDYLLGNATVVEPHSFSVVVTASENGKQHRWAFDSFEGRTTIGAKEAQAAGVITEVAGGATIVDALALTGRVVPNAEYVRSVTARYPGAINGVFKSMGDSVQAGERLALVESSDSLQTYTITAPIAGVVLERHANVGETAGSEPLFVIADHRRLWLELSVFPRDMPRVKTGQTVQLKAVDADVDAGSGKIVRIAPAEGAAHGVLSGIYTARVDLDNSAGKWAPGLFMRGDVQIGSSAVPLAVKRSGLQSFRDFTVVYERVGDTYEVRMLELGRQDKTHVEVLGGLSPGARYVSENSYLIKADIDKSGASHDH